MNAWLALGVAIVGEVVATSALKASANLSRLWPSLIVLAGYAVAFYCLSITIRTLPVGIAYAVWSGVGIVLITAIAWMLYGQKLDPPAILGLALIITGVAVINLFSRSVEH